MRNAIHLLALVALTALFTAGCAGPEQKMGRGISNTVAIINLGEINRGVEQAAVMGDPGPGYATGLVHGFDQSVKRLGLGIYEIVSFPFPPYHPILTKYVPPGPQFPDSYRPGLIESTPFQTDTYFGFSGGDVAPMIPGSRFSIFPNSN